MQGSSLSVAMAASHGGVLSGAVIGEDGLAARSDVGGAIIFGLISSKGGVA